jgi:uncharacterized RDD family membrane protein YckC
MMTLEDRLSWCINCINKKTNTNMEIVCSLSDQPPDFDENCEHYKMEEKYTQITPVFTEEITIETAKAGKRFLNYIIDLICFYIITFFLGFVYGIIAIISGMDVSWLAHADILTRYFIGFIVLSAYYAFFEGLFSATPGKFITGTRVVTEDGLKPSFNTILGRTLCRFIPFDAFSFLGASAIGWHDSISKTRVVIIKKNLVTKNT